MTCWTGHGFAAQTSGILTLEEAVSLALNYNRSIEQAQLAADEYDHEIAAAKTKRLVQFKLNATTGIMLTRPTLTFEKGAFGEYSGIGPIPGTTTNISSPRKPTAIIQSEAALPLSQQYRIGLGIKQLQLSKSIAGQQVRLSRQETVKQVRQTYYSILQSQSSLDAVEHNLALLRELRDQTAHYVTAGTVLTGDLLNVKARLLQAEYDKVAFAGPLATQKEQLNSLLGRPIETDFRVEPAVEGAAVPELVAARQKAIGARPEIEQARLKIQAAELDWKKKKSEFIPDVSLAVNYYSAFNMSSSLPKNMAIAGVQTSFEPFDWGRRRKELSQKVNAAEQARLTLKDVEDKVRIEVGSAHRKMQEARVLLSASRAAQESTRESVRLANARFRHDAALIKTVLEAQADLAQANDRTQKALVAYWSARAELEMAMGEEK
ncbi:MAG: TolC family protein [Bryobacteraceae bacterium]